MLAHVVDIQSLVAGPTPAWCQPRASTGGICGGRHCREHGTWNGGPDIRCIETAEELSSELEGSFVHDPRRCSLGWLLRHQSYTTRWETRFWVRPFQHVSKICLLLQLNSRTNRELWNLRFVDSITVDPHKSGICPVPWRCSLLSGWSLKVSNYVE